MNRNFLPSITRTSILWTGVLFFLVAVFLVSTLGLLNGARIDVPFTYDGDGLEYNLLTKTMIETGWWMENPRVGYPGILEMYDYAIGSNLDFLVMKLLSVVSGNYAVVMNIYYILGFFLTALCSLYVFRQLKISYPIAVFGSILFTFMYYHFNRLGHYNLAAYYMIPLLILVILWVCQGEPLFIKRAQGIKKSFRFSVDVTSKGIIAIFILFISSTHSYYGFFGLLLLGAATLFVYSRSYDIFYLLNGFIAGVILALFAIINKLPSLLYGLSHGPSFVMSYRYPYEAEIWGMKLIQLILPTPGHNIPFLADIAQKYTLYRPLVNENVSASLGTIASIGFLLLFLWIFIRNFAPLQKRLGSRAAIMDNLSFMTIAAVLIGTIGGISAIIAQVFPDIHSYNRISLFIAFFGILAVLYLLQLLYEQYKAKMFFCPVFMVILLAVVSFGVYDQVPSGYSFTPGSDREIEFLSQQSYFQHIEDIMPTGASIFILPDIGGFPHSSPPGKIKGLDSMKPYLHTSDLKWNYPTMKGRFYDNWQVAIANSPVTDMIHHLYLSGFEGVLVDGFGYDDGGLAINKEITNTTGVSPRISVDSRYAFFDLTGYMAKKKSGLTIEQFESEKQKYLSTMQGREELQNPLFGVQIRSIDK